MKILEKSPVNMLKLEDSRHNMSSSNWKWSRMKIFSLIIVFLFILVNLQTNVRAKSREKPKEIKLRYILLWTPITTSPFSYWSIGREDFIKSKCPVTKCYITNHRDILGGDITKFDALVFNGRDLKNYKKSQLPKKRSSHQKYIFLNIESSDNQPICNPMFDNFFNWTATYKLSSDVVLSYFYIRNQTGEEVGPRVGMKWIDEIDQISGVNETFRSCMLQKKSKAVAWFVSHCETRSRREDYANDLKESLRNHNLTLDIFGRCGTTQCPRSDHRKCQHMLKNTYYFYLSFENSFAEDYVTEKALNPLLDCTVPIVYGGANYSRFLPPGSYIDARKYSTDKLADLIAYLTATPEEYQKLFRWRNRYSYHKQNNVCRMCEALNDQTKRTSHSVYRNFISWWNPNHKERCKHNTWGS